MGTMEWMELTGNTEEELLRRFPSVREPNMRRGGEGESAHALLNPTALCKN